MSDNDGSNLAFKWPVNIHQLPNLRQLHDLTLEVGGKFLILPDIYFSETKPFVDTVLIHIPTRTQNQFSDQAGKLGFSKWEEISEEVFEDELAFDPFTAHTNNCEWRSWNARLQMAYQHNYLLEHPVKMKEEELTPICGGATPLWLSKALDHPRMTADEFRVFLLHEWEVNGGQGVPHPDEDIFTKLLKRLGL